MSVPLSLVHPTRAIINLAAFRHNLERVKTFVGAGTKIMAVVKSHAYGHGVRVISREAVRGGVHYLGVARVDEGLELRNEGIDTPILVFEIAPEGLAELAITSELELSVSAQEHAELFASLAQRVGKKARLHAKIDTGMGRLGFDFRHAARAVEQVARLSGTELVGV